MPLVRKALTQTKCLPMFRELRTASTRPVYASVAASALNLVLKPSSASQASFSACFASTSWRIKIALTNHAKSFRAWFFSPNFPRNCVNSDFAAVWSLCGQSKGEGHAAMRLYRAPCTTRACKRAFPHGFVRSPRETRQSLSQPAFLRFCQVGRLERGERGSPPAPSVQRGRDSVASDDLQGSGYKILSMR